MKLRVKDDNELDGAMVTAITTRGDRGQYHEFAKHNERAFFKYRFHGDHDTSWIAVFREADNVEIRRYNVADLGAIYWAEVNDA